ncbi:hypothetical protein [Halobacillus amylolyticus]|uniref:Uncharacterized protein n=1 Tax=Halobacillus amylolyticus TaxID=2932259 RepID=A0ABY4H9G3_9BACI|nr:hypothetical protein [Halobacillus amylolyticus]UOR11239.1 hypothetical protein MUO15_16795 [Halobacillus amylolyticus]
MDYLCREVLPLAARQRKSESALVDRLEEVRLKPSYEEVQRRTTPRPVGHAKTSFPWGDEEKFYIENGENEPWKEVYQWN